MDRAAASVFVVIEGEDAHQRVGARAVGGERQIERVVVGKQLSLQAGAGPRDSQRPAALAGGAIDPQHMLEKNLGRAGEGLADQLAGAVAEKILADMGADQAEAEILEPRQRVDQRHPAQMRLQFAHLDVGARGHGAIAPLADPIAAEEIENRIVDLGGILLDLERRARGDEVAHGSITPGQGARGSGKIARNLPRKALTEDKSPPVPPQQRVRNWLSFQPFTRRPHRQGKIMDKDRIKGMGDQAKGAIKDAAGKATGDSKPQAAGKADKLKGKVENAGGGAKDPIREAADD